MMEMELHRQENCSSGSSSSSDEENSKKDIPTSFVQANISFNREPALYEPRRFFYPDSISSVTSYSPPLFDDPFKYYQRQFYHMIPYVDQYPFEKAKEKNDNISTRKMTDFSIRSIIGMS